MDYGGGYQPSLAGIDLDLDSSLYFQRCHPATLERSPRGTTVTKTQNTMRASGLSWALLAIALCAYGESTLHRCNPHLGCI
jgi:hypothetical protein